jgi:hypothetical protein
MKNIKTLLLAAAASLSIAGIANAQASRTWISGTGSDANPCSRTAPCQTWAGAISKTAAGGEIDALDPGGFGAVTITKAITLDGSGVFASTLVSGTNGIVVQAGASDNVILRRISINGLGTGINGIRFLSGKSLSVDGCYIFSFTNRGIDAVPNNSGANSALLVRDTFIQETGQEGIGIQPASGTLAAQINRVRQAHSANNSGLNAISGTKVSIKDSDFSQNPVGAGVVAQGSTAEVDVSETVLANNAFGVISGQAGGAAVVRLARCGITGNTSNGVLTTAPAQTIGFQSNMIEGNAGNNAITTHTAQ